MIRSAALTSQPQASGSGAAPRLAPDASHEKHVVDGSDEIDGIGTAAAPVQRMQRKSLRYNRRAAIDHATSTLALVDRPKRGFSVPLGQCLAGPLREWADDLLAPGQVRGKGLLNPAAMQNLRWRHVDKRKQHATALWNIIMLRAWSECWLKTRQP